MRKLLLTTAASLLSVMAFCQSGTWQPLDPNKLPKNGRGVYISDPSTGEHICGSNPEYLCAKKQKDIAGKTVLEFFEKSGKSMGAYTYTSAQYLETQDKVIYKLEGEKRQ